MKGFSNSTRMELLAPAITNVNKWPRVFSTNGIGKNSKLPRLMMPREDLMKDGEIYRGFLKKKEETTCQKVSKSLPMRTLTKMAPRKKEVPTIT